MSLDECQINRFVLQSEQKDSIYGEKKMSEIEVKEILDKRTSGRKGKKVGVSVFLYFG